MTTIKTPNKQEPGSMANTTPDWYARRDELEPGQVFRTLEGDRVQLDRRVPGDGTKWYVLDWSDYCKGWLLEDSTIEPGDLCGYPE